MAPRRQTVRLVLAAGCAAVVLGLCGVLQALSLPQLAQSSTATGEVAVTVVAGEDVDALDVAGQGRTARCRVGVDGRAALLTVETECDLSISVRDPLLRVLRQGGMTQTALFDAVAGIGATNDRYPVVEVEEDADRASVRLTAWTSVSWAAVEDGDGLAYDVVRQPGTAGESTRPRPGVVESRRLSVALTGLALAGFDGAEVPLAQDGTSATFEGPPSESLTLRMARTDRSYSPPPVAEEETPTSTLVFKPFLELMPFLLVLAFTGPSALRAFADVRRLARTVLGLAVVVEVLFLYLVTHWIDDNPFPLLSTWGFLVGVPLVTVLMTVVRGRAPRIAPAFYLYLVPSVVVLVATVWVVAAGDPAGPVTRLCVVVAAMCLAGVAAAVLVWGRSSALLGLTIALGMAAWCFAVRLVFFVVNRLAEDHGEGWTEAFLVPVGVTVGLCLYPPVRLALRRFPRVPAWVRYALPALSAVMLLSLARAIGVTSGFAFTGDDLAGAIQSCLVVLKVVLLVMVVPVLAAAARRRTRHCDPALRACAVVPVVLVLPGFVVSDNMYNLIAGLVAAGLLLVLVPSSSADRAGRLAAVSPKVHNRLVRAEVRRRVLRSAATQFLRGTRGDPVDWHTLGQRYDEIDAAEHQVVRDNPAHVTAAAAAFGSSGGQSRWQGMWHAAGVAALLALPLVAYEAWFTFAGTDRDFFAYSLLEAVDYLRVALRWLVYGALFGYFYTAIRGHNPTGKAIRLLTVLWVAETIVVLGGPARGWQLLLDVSVRLGLMTYFFIALALAWERHLTRLAGVPWGRARDLRRGRSLLAPATTVLVAAATVVVTTLTTAAISPIAPTPPIGGEPPGLVATTGGG